jgi:hypothetical protein
LTGSSTRPIMRRRARKITRQAPMAMSVIFA